MAALWDEAMVLSELSEIFPLAKYAPVEGRVRRKGALALAASVLLGAVALAGMFAFIDMREGAVAETNVVVAAPSTYETAIGQQSTVTLPDGSTVILNTNTLIEISYSASFRNVYLQRGEGYFEVRKDVSRPFRVHVDTRIVEATGTAFTVQRMEQRGIEVTVTEGSVNLRLHDADPVAAPVLGQQQPDAAEQNAAAETVEENIPLVAGESATVNEQEDSIEKQQMQREEIEVRLAWRHGMLLFQGEPLDQVLREVSRYTSIQIEADEAIRNIQVGGYFRAGDIDALLVAMRENFNIEAQRTSEDHIQLRAQE